MSNLSVLQDGTLVMYQSTKSMAFSAIVTDCYLVVTGNYYDGVACDAEWLDSYLLVNFY